MPLSTPGVEDLNRQLTDNHDADTLLRIVRSPTESLQVAASEDSRRRVNKRRRRDTIKQAIKKPFFHRSPSKTDRPRTGQSAVSRPDEDAVEDQPPIVSTSLGEEEQLAKAEGFVAGSSSSKASSATASARRPRRIYCNEDLPSQELDRYGQPSARYPRNKVRTSKYSLLSFAPKNLAEQFRRVANIYFLVMVLLQIFPAFGSVAPQIAMLPLVAVLTITAAKDGLEDWRRHQQDEEVNNSACTRLGNGWRNVNVPDMQSTLIRRIFRLGRPPPNARTHVSRGVRKLREKEGSVATDFFSSTTHLTKPEAMKSETASLADAMESLSYLPNGSRPSISDTLAPLSRSDSAMSSTTALQRRPSADAAHGAIDYSRRVSGTVSWELTLWKKLEVGDILLLREGEQIPADVVLLSTANEDGVAFVETKSLDGEQNLKPRRALRATMAISSEEDIQHAQFHIDMPACNANLYAFEGTLKHPVKGSSELAVEPITINELALRGCSLQNTRWATAMIVATGADTKLSLNAGDTPSKRSRIDIDTTWAVLSNFVLLVAACILCAVGNAIYLGQSPTSSTQYEPGIKLSDSAVVDGIITGCAALIILQNLVPISLVISVEMVKAVQALFMRLDRELYYEELDYPCVPRTWNIADDLGQVSYIASDKTGTLTCNVQEFQKCSINGVEYGEAVTEATRGAAHRAGADTSALDPAQNAATLEASKATMLDKLDEICKNRFRDADELKLVSTQLASDLTRPPTDQRQRIIDFFRGLALCHTVLAERVSSDRVIYRAESPDEAALVAGARDLGFVFLSRSTRLIELEILGQPEQWVPLRVLEFNSTRKRMSVIVRAPDRRLVLFTKGADTVIFARLRSDHDREAKDQLNADLETFANAGLRTLCVAWRVLEEEEFAQWARRYDAACAATDDREDAIERACELIETDLTLLGATGLEDRLQEGVPDAIAQLRQAGIKLWILTGDRIGTAIEIAFAASVLSPSMQIMILSAEGLEGARSQIESGLEKIAAARHAGKAREQFAVVIDGETLRLAFDASTRSLFRALGVQCETVVCCRVSPSQKAQVVQLLKEDKAVTVLAIGDGLNDCSMIQQAQIGVGICGREGAQAAMSADYAIGQFRFLSRLMLVHGRWAYSRIARMQTCFFEKSMVWSLGLLLIQFWSNFDAVYLYDVSLILAMSLIFTSLPCILLGAFDQDVSAAASLEYPILYKRGIEGRDYTRGTFWAAMLDGTWQGLVCFFVPFAVFSQSTSMSSGGYDTALTELGSSVAIAAVWSANLYCGLHIRYWTWLVWVAIIASNLSVPIWLLVFSFIPNQPLDNIANTLMSNPVGWLTLPLSLVLSLAPRWIGSYCQQLLRPSAADLVRERVLLRQPFLDGPLEPLGATAPAQASLRRPSTDARPNEPPRSTRSSPLIEIDHDPIELSSLGHGGLITAPTSPTSQRSPSHSPMPPPSA